MAAIFDLRHTQTYIATSLSVLLTPKNVGITVGISLLSCIEASIFHVRMWIHVFLVWPPPSLLCEWYQRMLPLTKTSLSSPNTNLTHKVIYSAISRISGLFTTCYYIAYFRWMSPIKVANMTSYLLRSRDVKVMKSMLSCRELTCAQRHEKFMSYLFRQKSYTVKSVLEVFPPICNTRVKY